MRVVKSPAFSAVGAVEICSFVSSAAMAGALSTYIDASLSKKFENVVYFFAEKTKKIQKLPTWGNGGDEVYCLRENVAMIPQSTERLRMIK